MSVTKVKAHADAYHLCMGAISPEDFQGNAVADAFAGRMANLAGIHKNQSDLVDRVDREAWLVQDRIIAITLAAMETEEGGGLQDEEMKASRRKEIEDRKEKEKARARKKGGRHEGKGILRQARRKELIGASGHELRKTLCQGKGGRIKWTCHKCLGARFDGALDRWLEEGGVCSHQRAETSEEGGVDTEAWIALRNWAEAAVGGAEEQDSLADIAAQHVSRCNAAWDDFSKRAVDWVIGKQQLEAEVYDLTMQEGSAGVEEEDAEEGNLGVAVQEGPMELFIEEGDEEEDLFGWGGGLEEVPETKGLQHALALPREGGLMHISILEGGLSSPKVLASAGPSGEVDQAGERERLRGGHLQAGDLLHPGGGGLRGGRLQV